MDLFQFIMAFLGSLSVIDSVRIHLSEVQCARACTLLENGATQRVVAVEYGVSQTCIRNVWRRYQENGNYQRRPGSGRLRSTDARDDRYLTILARRNPFRPARVLRNEFQHATRIRFSDQSVRNRLHEVQLHARRPHVVPRMTDAHRRARLAWAREHLRWNINQWSQILFTDESRFSVDHPDNRVRVWRTRGQRYDPQFAVSRDRWGRGSVMVWGGISANQRTELHVVQGNMNAINYRDNVLEPIVVPMAARMGAGFTLMDDNARPHRARIVTTFLEGHNMNRMEWPALSPDLNPIENIWAILGNNVRNHEPPVSSVAELNIALQEEWANIDQAVIRNTIRSMRQRCNDCVRLRGASTSY